MNQQADAQNSDGEEKKGADMMEIARFVAGAAVVFLVITTVLFRSFYIPSSSMVPTLEVGDRVIVLNFTYGWSRHSLPFGVGDFVPGGENRIFGRQPGLGDVVVFRHPDGGQYLIKRVIGRPGDRVQMRGGRLYLCQAPCVSNDDFELVEREENGQVRYRTYEGNIVDVRRYTETLPNGRSYTTYERINRGATSVRDTPVFTVPPNRVFVMGDNRDSSRDSRSHLLGFVPTEHLLGRAVTVLFTLKSCDREPGLSCPSGRVWRPL